jgi:prepilin-type N-terminal cleavage/methylation domain-containing protein
MASSVRFGSRSGFTLIELIIAITLVSAIVAGMLSAMRGGLLTLERVQNRIQESRGTLGLDQMVRRQIGGIVPAQGDCAIDPNNSFRGPEFRGNPEAMLFVTTYSVTQGARGYPHLVEYRVIPNNDGTVRVVMEELLFASPATTRNFCAAPNLVLPLEPSGRSMVIAPRVASARISYRQMDPYTHLGGDWLSEWTFPMLPSAIRIDMLPVGSIAVPLHVSRDPQVTYADRKENTATPQVNYADHIDN